MIGPAGRSDGALGPYVVQHDFHAVRVRHVWRDGDGDPASWNYVRRYRLPICRRDSAVYRDTEPRYYFAGRTERLLPRVGIESEHVTSIHIPSRDGQQRHRIQCHVLDQVANAIRALLQHFGVGRVHATCVRRVWWQGNGDSITWRDDRRYRPPRCDCSLSGSLPVHA